MLGKIALFFILLDIVLLYVFAFAGGWLEKLLGDDASAILLAVSIVCPVVCLGIAGVYQPVIVKNSDEIARKFAEELKDLNKRG